jgi:hypothetical protein
MNDRMNMKTYKNQRYGFEIDIPEQWSVYRERTAFFWNIVFWIMRGWIPGVEVAFTNGPSEIVNITTSRVTPGNEANKRNEYIHDIRFMGGTILSVETIMIKEKNHTCFQYHYAGQAWFKKYLVIINGFVYAITATCKDQDMFRNREPIWDQVAKSFRLP